MLSIGADTKFLPREEFLEFTLGFTNSRLPREADRLHCFA
jgi:hypothetical protein